MLLRRRPANYTWSLISSMGGTSSSSCIDRASLMKTWRASTLQNWCLPLRTCMLWALRIEI